MKIAFVGKGGSGKTTLASLFIRHLANQSITVLAIDADINQHLVQALGLLPAEAMDLPPMGNEVLRIKEYLRGDNARIGQPGDMLKTTPPGFGSKLLTVRETNGLYDYFTKDFQGMRLMATGQFTEEDLGIKCYHSKVGAAELVLSHLIDMGNEYVIVDMTAGADSFASGMFIKFDLTVLVVEPTLKSVSVYEQYKAYAKEYGVLVKVVGNKVEDADDEKFIRKFVGDDLLGLFTASSYVKRLEKGEFLPVADLEEENLAVFNRLQDFVDTLEKDWEKFYRQTVEFHIKNANSWGSLAAGKDLREQIHPDFSLSNYISEYFKL